MLTSSSRSGLLGHSTRPAPAPARFSSSRKFVSFRNKQKVPPAFCLGASRPSNNPVVKDLPRAVQQEQDDPSPFFEPLLRSFVLGLSAGGIVECGHIIFKLAGVALESNAEDLLEWLPTATDQLAPWFVWDHVAAMTSWAALYIIEAVAVISVLNKHGNDKEKAKNSLKSLMTWPKKILPLKLHLVRNIYSSVDRRAFASSSSSSSAAILAAPSQFIGSGTSSVTISPPTRDDSEVEVSVSPKIPSGPALRQKITEQAGKVDGRVGVKPGVNPLCPNSANRQKELNDRRSYLKNFWYAAALSENLTEKPLGVDILGRRVVLWRREDGSVNCLDDACPHRGAPLSSGWVEQKNDSEVLVCPYHGWAFDCKGHLRDVPSLENEGQWPKRELIHSYPVEEKGGFVWLFFGSKSLPKEERPPIPYTPELDDPEWKAVYGELEFECGHWGVFENAIDMAHIHYLHNDSFGNDDQPKIHDMDVKRDAYHVEASFRIHNKPVSPLWEFSKTDSVPVVAKAFLPSTSSITIKLGAGISFVTFVSTVPISADRCVNRFCLVRNFAAWDGFDVWARQAMFRILGEDKVMVEKLRPELLPFEVSLTPDLPQIEFRKLRQEYINMGYGVAPEPEQQRAEKAM